MTLEMEIKDTARESGAALVGIASRDRLVGAPPSVDPSYLLPSTRSIISLAVPQDRRIIRDYLSKKDWLAHGTDRKRMYQKLYTIADRLADFLKGKGFEAIAVDANDVWRPEEGGTDSINVVMMVPDFSHRYGAVAAGLGWLGWSGNLMTHQFGSTVGLTSVLTSAVLEADPLLEANPCDKCKLCTTVCPVEMISTNQTTSITIAGKEYTHSKKENNARCILGCSGYHGLAPNKKWSTWSPYRINYPLPSDEAELIAVSRQVRSVDPDLKGSRALLTQRDKCFDPNETYINTCGNCGIICWEKREDREENQRLLTTSGVVVLSARHGRIAVSSDETIEIDTPYMTKVAVLRDEYPLMVALKKADVSVQRFEAGQIVIDNEVLSFIANSNH